MESDVSGGGMGIVGLVIWLAIMGLMLSLIHI